MCVDAQFEDYCIADEQYRDDELMYAMKWACSNGAECSALEENKPCFFPNTTKDHASYAFNSYYQNTKHIGGSCYFIAAALLTALNPSNRFSSHPLSYPRDYKAVLLDVLDLSLAKPFQTLAKDRLDKI